MKHTSHIHRGGFSLIEVLVYVTVLVIASSAVVATFLGLKDVFERNRVERVLNTAAATTLERVGREIRAADSVDVLRSSFGTSSPGVLTLVSVGTTTKFYVATGTVAMDYNGKLHGPLVPAGVKIERLAFWRYSNSFSEAVRTQLVLSATSSRASTTKTFYTTAVLRGSYE